jgi:hypothetical protein
MGELKNTQPICKDASILWLLHGGFLFLDFNKKIIGAAAVCADRFVFT